MQKSHIYFSRRHIHSGVNIQLLCNEKWVEAEEEEPERSHANLGYVIDGVHQWSIGAGHNADCPKCLIKYAERKMRTDQKLMIKILEIAKGHVF